MKKNPFVGPVVRIGVLYAGICFLVFLFQRSLLYFPTHATSVTGLTPWVVDGETIGYFRDVKEPRTVWLMMHGNAGQASDRDYVLGHLSEKDALYVLEYPGYGARAGSPSQKSIDRASSEAYRILQNKYATTPLCVIGESIGSGPASALASQPRPPEKIVLITPFDSLYAVASRRFFILPVWLLLLDRWDNIQALGKYAGPVDIIAGTEDTIIPMAHARRLADACKSARFIQFQGGHNDWSIRLATEIER